jgi:transcriptional regulator with GAF, ATPase, and Fis domain
MSSPEHGMSEEHLKTLLRVSRAINCVRDLDILLNEIADSLIRSVGVERALLFLRNPETDELHFANGRNVRQETLEHAAAISKSVLREVDLHGTPFISANVRTDPRVSGLASVISFNLGTVLCAPLRAGEQILGVLYADHPSPVGILSESTIGLFAAFCNLAAVAIDNALVHKQLLEEKTELEQHLREALEGCQEIVGESAAIQQLREDISHAASSPLGVLIYGESGTGKELVARAIHRMGRRSAGRFVTADCGSFADSLVESELFGVRKGAFTGSTENRAGLFETAHGGVLFLDEVSNLTLKLQAKLLRVLEEREIRRIGEMVPRKVDVQVIAATNRDLLKEIDKRRFREDLYYRLNAMEIRLPALRDRLEDVPLLVGSFLSKAAKEEGKTRRFASEAISLLSSYSFPGNVRELKNIVLRCYYTAKGPLIRPEDLPQEVRGGKKIPVPGDGLDESRAGEIYRMIRRGRGSFLESVQNPFSQRQFGKGVVRQIIRRALVDSVGSYRQAFRLLGIPDTRYAITIQFLKRNDCYLDFRPFRKCARDSFRGNTENL